MAIHLKRQHHRDTRAGLANRQFRIGTWRSRARQRRDWVGARGGLMALLAVFLICGCTAVKSPVRELSGATIQLTQELETATMARVETLAEEQRARFGARNVLLVFDIDNTMLAMNQDLGSDQWFNWQYRMLDDENRPHGRVAEDMQGLLRIQRELFALSATHPVEQEIPAIVRRLQDAGHPVIALTSRGPANRDATERELGENGIALASSEIGYDIGGKFNIACQACLGIFSTDQIEQYKLSHPRKVSYSAGIFMSEGQHKGAMLVLLLEHFDVHFDAIIFVDDHLRNCARVLAAVDGRWNQDESPDNDVVVRSVHFTGEADHVREFEASDKGDVIDAYAQFAAMKAAVFK